MRECLKWKLNDNNEIKIEIVTDLLPIIFNLGS